MLFLKEHKHKLYVGAVAYFLYTFSRLDTYDMSGVLIHVVLNSMIFLFVAQAVVTFAEKVVVDRRKKAV